MSHPQIAAFARLADGDAKPTRTIAGQKTLITRTIHDMEYDPIHDEIVIPQYIAQAILIYRGGANGDEAPVRVIQGPDTQLRGAERLALDPVHNEIFVPQGDHVLVFPSRATGNVAPVRVLKGPDTLLGASALAVDPIHDLLLVSGSASPAPGEKRRGQVLIFNRTDQGNTKPRAIIAGPHSLLTRPMLIKVYPPKEEFLLGISSVERSGHDNFVGVWSEHDNGDVPPRYTIGGPNGMLRQVRGITIDAKHKSVIVADKFLNAIMTYYFPEFF